MSVNPKSSRSTRSLSNMSEAMTGSSLLTSSSKLNDFSSHSSSLSESPSINSAPTVPPPICIKPQAQKLTRSKVIFNKNKKFDDSKTRPANFIDLNPIVSLVLSESSNISIPQNSMMPIMSPRKDITFTKSPKKMFYNTSSTANTINQ